MSNNDESQSDQPTNTTNTPQYADELPDACPPADAIDASGTFYSTHRVSPPDGSDFRTAAENNRFKQVDECRRRGNSILESIEDARQLCKAHPDIHIYVSEGVLQKGHGKLLKTKAKYPSHHTLWRYHGVSMHKIFIKVV